MLKQYFNQILAGTASAGSTNLHSFGEIHRGLSKLEILENNLYEGLTLTMARNLHGMDVPIPVEGLHHIPVRIDSDIAGPFFENIKSQLSMSITTSISTTAQLSQWLGGRVDDLRGLDLSPRIAIPCIADIPKSNFVLPSFLSSGHAASTLLGEFDKLLTEMLVAPLDNDGKLQKDSGGDFSHRVLHFVKEWGVKVETTHDLLRLHDEDLDTDLGNPAFAQTKVSIDPFGDTIDVRNQVTDILHRFSEGLSKLEIAANLNSYQYHNLQHWSNTIFFLMNNVFTRIIALISLRNKYQTLLSDLYTHLFGADALANMRSEPWLYEIFSNVDFTIYKDMDDAYDDASDIKAAVIPDVLKVYERLGDIDKCFIKEVNRILTTPLS